MDSPTTTAGKGAKKGEEASQQTEKKESRGASTERRPSKSGPPSKSRRSKSAYPEGVPDHADAFYVHSNKLKKRAKIYIWFEPGKCLTLLDY